MFFFTIIPDLLAELIAQHHPKLVDLHHYVRASSLQNKRHNWHHLRRKVLSNPKIDLHLSDELIEMIIESKPGAIDKVDPLSTFYLSVVFNISILLRRY